MRDGKAYREAIDDDRAVWIDGERVEKVSQHPAFEACVSRVAALLDLHVHPEHVDLLTDVLETGQRVPSCYRVPKSADDLQRLGSVSTMFARRTLGMMGRLWDPSASYIVGMYNARADAERLRPGTGRVLEQLFHRCRSDALLCNVAFVDPPFGRMDPVPKRDTLRTVKSTSDGIVVTGAKTLCTGAAYSDEIVVITGCGVEARSPEQIVGFVIRPASRGLSILCRPTATPPPSGRLSHAIRGLDETDACLVFDQVHVPHDRVLYSGEVKPASLLWDCIVAWDKHSFLRRIVAKFEALFGLAYLMAEALGVLHLPQVHQVLFDAGRHHAMLQRLVSASEREPHAAPGAGGAVTPDPTGLLLALHYAIENYPTLLRSLEVLGGQGLVLVPSERDLASSEIGGLYRRYLKGPSMDAAARASLLTLAGELIGSRLSSRQRLLDFYALGGLQGLQHQLRARFDWGPPIELVKSFIWSAEGDPNC